MNPDFRTRVRARVRLWRWSALATAVFCLAAGPQTASAQQPTELDSLVRRAVDVNSAVRGAAARVDAVRARVVPAAAWPDPMLMLGAMNVPLSGRSAGGHGMPPDAMRMNVVGLEQMVPYPGKLSLARRAAEARVREAEAVLVTARRETAARVRSAYFEIAFATRAVQVVERNAAALRALIGASEARYGTGAGGQVEVLNARVESTRLGEAAAELHERRSAAVALLNALLERPSDSPVAGDFPPALTTLAAPPSRAHAQFVSQALGARAADSPLKTVEELQRIARDASPVLLRHQALVESRRAEAALARRESLPDVSLAVEYGQRREQPDVVSARIGVALPIFRRRKQDPLAEAAASEVMAAEAEALAAEHALAARIAELHARMEQQRTTLALQVGAVIPQAQATLQAAIAGYQSGRTSLFEVLGHQAALFQYDLLYFRALADFAAELAELENVVGAEVLQ